MTQLTCAAPEPRAILQAWMPFREAIGVTTIRSEADYERARAIVEALLTEIGDNEDHPLAEVLDYLADHIEAWEAEHTPIPEAAPGEVLRLLMEQHHLKQEDLADCAPQSRISDYLAGRRAISKEVAKRLAQRFSVRADLFL